MLVAASCTTSSPSGSLSAATQRPTPPTPPRTIQPTPPVVASPYLPGVDVLAQRGYAVLKGKRVGLLTHPAAVNRQGVPTVDVLRKAPGVHLVALFGPEHGIYGDEKANASISDRIDPRSGLPVYSLYGKTRAPTPAMLEKIDVMVIDLQDVGARSYTYISAMRLVMEECFKSNKEVVILDRPNPMGGLKVDGPIMEGDLMSYVGSYRIPYVYGLTIGELALMARDTPGWLKISESQRIHARLTVIPMSGWTREMIWSDTGMEWRSTSPMVPDYSAAVGYSMTGLGCQLGGFVHGLTKNQYVFRVIKYPNRSPEEIATALRACNMPGVAFRVVSVKTNGKTERGVFVLVSDWKSFRPTEVSFYMMRLACRYARESGKPNPFARASASEASLWKKHTGNKAIFDALARQGEQVDIASYIRKWEAEARVFQEQSRRYWLYWPKGDPRAAR
jgi:uncharacterized protein YbbC (DUF1343 family)